MAKYNAGSYGFTKDCIICFDDVKTYMNENFFSINIPCNMRSLFKSKTLFPFLNSLKCQSSRKQPRPNKNQIIFRHSFIITDISNKVIDKERPI